MNFLLSRHLLASLHIITMFRIHRAIARALATTPIAIPRTRVITQFPSRTFVQCRPRWTEHSSQEQAATSESTDTVSTDSPAANESAPPADQAEAATSETTDQINTSPEQLDQSRATGRHNAHTVYVGNISFETSEQSLRDLFGKYGEVKGIDVVKNDLGRSKGFAFVHYHEESPLLQAVRDSGLEQLDGRRLFVQPSRKDRRDRGLGDAARSPPPRRQATQPSTTLFIGNLSYQMSDRDLNDLFRDIKGILDVRVAISRTSGQPRGFAHADFRDVESCREAKNLLEGKSVYGRALNVDFAKPASAYNGPPQ